MTRVINGREEFDWEEATEADVRAVLREILPRIGAEHIERGMATFFEKNEPFREMQSWHDCFVARMYGPPGAAEDRQRSREFAPMEEGLADAMGLDQWDLTTLSSVHWHEPRMLYEECCRFLVKGTALNPNGVAHP